MELFASDEFGLAIIGPHSCKPIIMCQNWADSGPMLAASAQNRFSSGTHQRFYRFRQVLVRQIIAYLCLYEPHFS